MAILRAANSLWLNILLVIIILIMVFGLPAVDRRVCDRLGINVLHNVNENPHAEKLLILRKFVLYVIFAVYMCANLYLVFFSRSSGTDFSVHVSPLEDLANSVEIDSSPLAIFSDILLNGVSYGLSHIQVIKPADITQATTNILFYIPMGYLLPYVFDWFRKNKRRAATFCLAFSLITENMQLMFKRGCYDFDDLVFNTVGGLIGVMLYRYFAYYVTHPNWRKDLKNYYAFRRSAHKTARFKYANDIDCGRVTLMASRMDDVYDFYIKKLGFHLKGQALPLDSDTVCLMMKLGGLYVEFVCNNGREPIPPQTIMLSCGYLQKIRKRLVKKGIEVSDYAPDPYNQHKSMYIIGPDNVKIIFGEY